MVGEAWRPRQAYSAVRGICAKKDNDHQIQSAGDHCRSLPHERPGATEHRRGAQIQRRLHGMGMDRAVCPCSSGQDRMNQLSYLSFVDQQHIATQRVAHRRGGCLFSLSRKSMRSCSPRGSMSSKGTHLEAIAELAVLWGISLVEADEEFFFFSYSTPR